MGTQVNEGEIRNAQHIFYTDDQGATAASSIHGYSEFAIDIQNACIRVHNGVKKGGVAVIPLYSPTALPVASFSPQQVTFSTTPAAMSIAIAHNLGRRPLVQVIDDSTGEVVDAEIKHDDSNNITVTTNTPMNGYIVYH